MQTRLLGDDLDFLTWGVCPECGERDHPIRHDESRYECECGSRFPILDGKVFASNATTDETYFDVRA
jgi:hypothetical protein